MVKGSIRKLLKRLNRFVITQYSDASSAPGRRVTSQCFRARVERVRPPDSQTLPTIKGTAAPPHQRHHPSSQRPSAAGSRPDPSPHAQGQLGNGSLVEGAGPDVIIIRHRVASVNRSRRFPPVFPALGKYGIPAGPGPQLRLWRD